MFGKLFKFIRPELGFNNSQSGFFNQFIDQAPNAWIAHNSRVQTSLKRFFAVFPTITLNRIADKNIYLVLCSGHMSAAIQYESDASVILIFPDLYRALVSQAPEKAYAILAHEIGHILYNHYARGTSAIDAQIEADAFACSLGFREPILALLKEDGSEESKVRVDYITNNLSAIHEKSA